MPHVTSLYPLHPVCMCREHAIERWECSIGVWHWSGMLMEATSFNELV